MTEYEKLDDINRKLLEYAESYDIYSKIKNIILARIEEFYLNNPTLIYDYKGRIKKFDSYKEKIEMGRSNNDIVGIKLIYYFREDIPRLHLFLKEHFELKSIDIYTDKNNEKYFKKLYSEETIKPKIDTEKFEYDGYNAIHYSVFLKDKKLSKFNKKEPYIEIQLKNPFENAFGEFSHDINYKFPKMAIQDQFKEISESLIVTHSTIVKLNNHIKKQMDEFIEKVNIYYNIDIKENNKPLNLKIKSELYKNKINLEDISKKMNDTYSKITKYEKNILLLDDDLSTFFHFIKLHLADEHDRIQNTTRHKHQYNIVNTFIDYLYYYLVSILLKTKITKELNIICQKLKYSTKKAKIFIKHIHINREKFYSSDNIIPLSKLLFYYYEKEIEKEKIKDIICAINTFLPESEQENWKEIK